MVKYFISKDGALTQRLANSPGKGHIEIALSSNEVLDSSSDIYLQMAQKGYIRVVETDDEIHVDAPRGLTNAQKKALEDIRFSVNKPVLVNSRLAIESRTSKKEVLAIVERFLNT